ncbi:MAG: S-layer homology domain-containing protein [Acidobacteriota bacterium]
MIRRTCLLLCCLLALALFAGPISAQTLQDTKFDPYGDPVPDSPGGPVLPDADTPSDPAGTPLPGETEAIPTPPPASFVTVNGGRFWVDGHPFRHVGVNGGFYQGDDIWNDTWYLRQGGVKQIRLILPNTQYPDTQEVIGKLGQALDAAWNRGIRITVVMTDFYFGDHWGHEGRGGHDVVPGDEPYYTVNYNGVYLLNYKWISGGFRSHYKPFVAQVVNAFKNDPRVFAWEIGNEIGAPTRPDGQPAIDETVAFYREMAQYIKSLDGNHLVAPGIICTRWLSLNSTQKAQLYQYIDYVTEHHYVPRNNEGSLADDALALSYGKPLVIEEYGVSQWEPPYNADHDLIMPTVNDFFDWAYAAEPVKTADSVMVWGVDFGYDLGADDHQFGPNSQGLSNDYLQLWRESADWLRPSPRYSDVLPGSTFYSYIECLSNRRAVSGLYSWVDDNHNDEFRPGEAITRAQSIKAIVRAMGFQLQFPSTPTFTDVPRSSPYYRYIETAVALGIINGYQDHTFRPDAYLTRGQMTKVIINAGIARYGWSLNTAGGPHFIDVPVDQTFYVFIETAYNRGIINGYANGYFYPGNYTTRGQFAKMLAQAVSCGSLAD